MKKFTPFFFIVFLFAFCSTVNGQIHPLAFGATNWYTDYVGIRLFVTTPGIIAGEKVNAPAIVGSVTGGAEWPDIVYSSLINVPVVIPPVTDSEAATPFATGSMTGMICLIWRGPSSSPVSFSQKALYAQNAGAVACIIMNAFPGSSPFSPGYTSGVGTITIPVIMIGYDDASAIEYEYNLSPGSVRMTITLWNQNYNNNLGFVPDGAAGWHDYAIPSNQLFSGGNPSAYKGMDGAFIANYGLNNATHIKVNDTLKYTPSGGGTSVIHTDVSPTLVLFPPSDSIYAMLAPAEYNFAPTGTGTGRFDLTYTINSDSVDQYLADDTATYSFYTTDSLYSKGRYDFINNAPVCDIYATPFPGTDFLWGPMYYVAHQGTAISSVQFSISSTTSSSTAHPYYGTASPISLGSMNIYAFKWLDGSGGHPLDGLVQNGELSLIALGIYTFLGSDTSGGVFTVQMGDTLTGTPGATILLDSNSWYYIAANVPSGYFLGCDGQQSPYPRIYSRYHSSGTMDYSSVEWTGDYPFIAMPGSAAPPCPFPGTANVNSVDSFNYTAQIGMIPAIALIVNNNPFVISGTASLCIGSTTMLTIDTSGGVWSSSNTAIASIGSGSGVVTGVSGGLANITYSVGSISSSITVTVNPYVGAITGTPIVSEGGYITLNDGTTGGVWSSSDTSVATVGSGTGTVAGVSTGTVEISYTVIGSCGTGRAIDTVSVLAAITGISAICIGSTTTLTIDTSGGIWSSSNTAIATVGSVTGIVAGVSAGTAVITYTVGSSVTTDSVTVNATARIITGSSTVTAGSTTFLSDSTSGGIWNSNSAFIATVDSFSGFVSGISPGIVVISYTVSNVCGTSNVTDTITVLAAITGNTSVCVGMTTNLFVDTTGGFWSSGNTAVAIVGSVSGVVTGVAGGTTTISYTYSGVSAIKTITVLPIPNPGSISFVSGTSNICVGASIILFDGIIGGTWSCVNATATVSGGGVTGVTPGIDTIIYTVTNSDCSASVSQAVDVLPAPIVNFSFVQDEYKTNFFSATDTTLTNYWDFGDGNTINIADPYHQYYSAGVYDVCFTRANSTCATTVCQNITVATITISPNQAANAGAVTVDITGAGFLLGTTFALKMAGQPDITGDTLIIFDPSDMRTTLNLAGVVTGQWNVQVITPTDTFLLPDGFTIIPTNPADTSINITLNGPSIIRLGFQQIFTITIQNNRETDVNALPVFITGLPPQSTIRYLNSSAFFDSLPDVKGLQIDWDDSTDVIFDSISNTSFAALIVPKVSAGGTAIVHFIINPPDTMRTLDVSHQYYNITATLKEPLVTTLATAARSSSTTSDEYPIIYSTQDYNNCMEGDGNDPGLLVNQLSLSLDEWAVGVLLYGALVPPSEAGAAVLALLAHGGSCLLGISGNLYMHYQYAFNESSIIKYPQLLNADIHTLLNCAVLLQISKFVINQTARATLKEEIKDKAGGDIASWALCNYLERGLSLASIWSAIGTAFDPNEKYGPGSGSTSHYTNTNNLFGYTISFENKPTATLPAQTVQVIDTLDKSVFAVSTFGFTSVIIGDSMVTFTNMPKSFIRDIDLTATMGVKARVTGSIDTVTGIVKWLFTTIDPVTNQVTTNALAGFLPPDTSGIFGTGYVSYLVKSTAGNMDTVHNTATIIFDSNAAITTNDWPSVIDTIKPHSHVLSLPAVTTVDTFAVHWTGIDTFSGVRYYSIYVSTDSGEYQQWLVNQTDTMAYFPGANRHTYKFFSIATDSAGNVEYPPLTYEAITRIQLDTAATANNTRVYPNPASTTVYIDAPSQVNVMILSIDGKLILSQKYTNSVDVQLLPDAVYIVKIMDRNNKPIKVVKLVKLEQ